MILIFRAPTNIADSRLFGNNAIRKIMSYIKLCYNVQSYITGTNQIKWPQKRQNAGTNKSSEPKLQRLEKRTTLGILL